MSDQDEDPYAVSSESEDESPKGPPPKINIVERAVSDISSIKAAFNDAKGEEAAVTDAARAEELKELAAKKEIAKLKKEFLEGPKTDEPKPDEEKEPITVIPKETYSKFKEKFEKLPETLEQSLEEKLREKELDLAPLGKENLKNIKGAFENPKEDMEIQREKIVLERTEADRKRIISAFTKPEMTAEEAPRECAVCSKMVYPVERIFANKCLYHNYCFKCSKCSKKLTPTNYNMHEGTLLCKVHYMEVFNPDIAKTMNPETTEEDERVEDEDEDFAVSSKPKRLGADVVRSGFKTEDDLAALGSLKERKGDWESSAKETSAMERKTQLELEEELISGKVKSNLEKFVKGDIEEVTEEDKKKPLEDLNLEEIGNIKNKWKTGNVEGAERKEMSKEELEELRRGPALKERFKERTEAEENAVRQWDKSELDLKAVADARKSFLEGSAFQSGPIEKAVEEVEFKKLQDFKERFERGEESTPVERTAIDIKAEGLGDLKAAFEKGATEEDEMTPEERAALKQKEIEAEFLRYKLARRAAAQRAAAEQAAGGANFEQALDEVIPAAEVGSIKDRFEKGEAFKNAHEEKQLDVEIKMAGKAREKFLQIDAEGSQMISPTPKEKHESKWDKKTTVVPEVINKRVIENEPDEPEDEDAFDVKNLMNKFKNIEHEPTKAVAHERPLDLEGIKVEARNLKEQFEKVGTQTEAELAEEKRRQLEEEFAKLKEAKEAAQAAREVTPEEDKVLQKEEIQIAADHASKMTAKWEKIQRKEAKKAEKSKMPQRTAAQAVWWAQITAPPICDACKRGVYMAERFECFSQLYHQNCFRCKHCNSPLRTENCQRSAGGDLFCETHYRRLFVPQSSFVFTTNQRFVASG